MGGVTRASRRTRAAPVPACMAIVVILLVALGLPAGERGPPSGPGEMDGVGPKVPLSRGCAGMGPGGDAGAAGPRSSSLLDEGFESGDGGFTHGGTFDTWQRGEPGGQGNNSYPDGSPPPSGASVFATGLNDTYPENCDMRLTTPYVDLGDMAGAELGFWVWLDLSDDDEPPGPGSDGGDVLVLEASNSTFPGQWIELRRYNSTTTDEEGWVFSRVDLTSMAGNSVRISWRLEDRPDGREGAGAFIDDVEVSGVPRHNLDVGVARVRYPDVSAPGETFSIDVRLDNHGLSDAPEVELEFTVMDGDGEVVHQVVRSVYDVERNSGVWNLFQWVPGDYGWYTWDVRADLPGDGNLSDNTALGDLDVFVPIFNDDMEGGGGKFSHEADQGQDPWRIVEDDDRILTRSGTGCWGFTDDTWTGYPPLTLAHLSFDAGSLMGYREAWLSFWHLYEFEHDEAPYDGGAVEVSLDGGLTWTEVEPRGGYPGAVAGGTGNPMEGRDAFVGSSGGAYRRVLFPLDDYLDIPLAVRFTGGTDMSSSSRGWFIDDIWVFGRGEDEDVVQVLLDDPPGAAAFRPWDEAADSAGGAWEPRYGDSLTGDAAWRFGGEEGGDYAPDNDSSIRTDMDLRWVDPPAELTFWHRHFFHGGEDGEGTDGGFVEVRIGDGPWSLIRPEGGYPGVMGENAPFDTGGADAYVGSDPNWTRQNFDLSGYAGESISLRLRAVTDDDGGGQGWYVDLLRVTAREQEPVYGLLAAALHPASGPQYSPLDLEYYTGADLEFPVRLANQGNTDMGADIQWSLPQMSSGGTTLPHVTVSPSYVYVERGGTNLTMVRIVGPGELGGIIAEENAPAGAGGNDTPPVEEVRLRLTASIDVEGEGGEDILPAVLDITLREAKYREDGDASGPWTVKAVSASGTEVSVTKTSDSPGGPLPGSSKVSLAAARLSVERTGENGAWACVVGGDGISGAGGSQGGAPVLGVDSLAVKGVNASCAVEFDESVLYEADSFTFAWSRPLNDTWTPLDGDAAAHPEDGSGGDLLVSQNFTLSPDMPGDIIMALWAEPDVTAPDPVDGLEVVDDGNGSLLLTWSQSREPDFSHYNVFSSRFPFQTIGGNSPDETIGDRNATETLISGLQWRTTYYFAVTAVDLAGNEDRNITGIPGTVLSSDLPNESPTAVIEPLDGDVPAGETVYFSGGYSKDDGRIVEYQWDFDDEDGVAIDALGANPTHRFMIPGTYVVTLTVVDEWGATGSTTMEVEVVKSRTSGDRAPEADEGAGGAGGGILLGVLSAALFIALIFLLAFGRRRPGDGRGPGGKFDVDEDDEDDEFEEGDVLPLNGGVKGVHGGEEVGELDDDEEDEDEEDDDEGDEYGDGDGERMGEGANGGAGGVTGGRGGRGRRVDAAGAGRVELADGGGGSEMVRRPKFKEVGAPVTMTLEDGGGRGKGKEERKERAGSGMDDGDGTGGAPSLSDRLGERDRSDILDHIASSGDTPPAAGDRGATRGGSVFDDLESHRDDELQGRPYTLMCPDCDGLILFKIPLGVLDRDWDVEVVCQHCGASGVVDMGMIEDLDRL